MYQIKEGANLKWLSTPFFKKKEKLQSSILFFPRDFECLNDGIGVAGRVGWEHKL